MNKLNKNYLSPFLVYKNRVNGEKEIEGMGLSGLWSIIHNGSCREFAFSLFSP
jgi:hypothetical protein